MNTAFRFVLLFIPIFALAAAVVLIEQGRKEGPAASVSAPSLVPPAQAQPVERVPTALETAFAQELATLGEGFDGAVGIAVGDAATGALHSYRGEEAFPQQSVSKLWVTLTALDQVDRGELDLAEPVVIRQEDLTLFHQPIREIVRTRGAFRTDYADLMQRAITGSDNAANDRLLRRVGGPEAVQDFLDSKAITGVTFGTDERSKQSAIAGLRWNQGYSYGRRFYEARDLVPAPTRRQAFEAYLSDPIDGATPVGIAQALMMLAEGQLLSPASTRLLRETLQKTRSGPSRLKGGVPPGWTFGHKTGTGQVFDGEQSGYNDIGLLTAPDGAEYALVVMIGRTRASNPTRMALMQAVTRATVAFHAASQGEASAVPESTS